MSQKKQEIEKDNKSKEVEEKKKEIETKKEFTSEKTKTIKEEKNKIDENNKSNNSQPVEHLKNDDAVAGLILGILSIVFIFDFTRTVNYLVIPCGIIGIILSVRGRKIEYRKNVATAGLVFSIIGLSLFLIISIIFLFLLFLLFFLTFY